MSHISVNILLKDEIDNNNNKTKELQDFIANIAHDWHINQFKFPCWTFWIKVGALIPEHEIVGSWSDITIEIGYEPYLEDIVEIQETLENIIGYFPKQIINVSSRSGGVMDQKHIAIVCLKLMEIFTAYLDLGGTIDYSVEGVEVVDLSSHEFKNIARKKGEIFEITDSSRNLKHIIDKQFLEEWLNNPHFYMIQ